MLHLRARGALSDVFEASQRSVHLSDVFLGGVKQACTSCNMSQDNATWRRVI